MKDAPDTPWVSPRTLRWQIAQGEHLPNLCLEGLLRFGHWSARKTSFWELSTQWCLKTAQKTTRERLISFSCLSLFLFYLLSSHSLDRPVRLPSFFLHPASLWCDNTFHAKLSLLRRARAFLGACRQGYCPANTHSVWSFRISSSSCLSHFWLSP